MLFTSCGATEENFTEIKTGPSSVTLSQSSVTLRAGFSATLSATVHPWNSNDVNVVWSSADESVASVSEQGTVTANTLGETTVTAKCGKVSNTCKVTVTAYRIPAVGISLSDENVSLKNGESATLKAVVSPSSSTDQVVWTSSDSGIATVDLSGKVTAVSSGYADITATAGDISSEMTVLVHGNLWMEQVDPLIKPVSMQKFSFKRDTIRVAKGETATIQMLVYADSGQGLVTPSVTSFAPDGGSGLSLAPKVYWVRDIKCTPHWDTWAGGKAPDRYEETQLNIPDPLMPLDDWKVTMSSGDRAALWVEFNIPRDFQPGLYDGVAKIEGTDSGELPFTVKVYDVSLPEKQGLNVVNWVNEELSSMNNGESTEMYWVRDQVKNTIIPFMNDYGQNVYALMYARRSNTPSKVVYNTASGQYELKYDFSLEEAEFKVFLESCPDLRQVHGINIIAGRDKDVSQYLMPGYRLDDNGKIIVNDDGTIPLDYYNVTGNEPGVEMFLKVYFSQLKDFLSSHYLSDGRTWFDIYVQTIADEPNDDYAASWNAVARYVKKGAPGIKILEPIETGKLDPDLLDYICPKYDAIETQRATGNQVQWIYTCMSPQGNYANRFIRIPLLKTRIVHWMNYKLKAVGYLHWGLNYWHGAPNGDPWSDAFGQFIGGDMFIIYPGYKKVYPSIRLCAMRDGIRDYDLLKEVEAKSPAKAEEFCARLVKANDSYDMDIDHFRELRKDILEYLSE